MKCKRVAEWEHKISQNIRATEHLVRQEVSKDLNFLRRLLNEVNFLKVKVSKNFSSMPNRLFLLIKNTCFIQPVYTDEDSKKQYSSLPRSSSCPELSLFHYKTPPRSLRGRSCSVANAVRTVRKGSRSSTTTLNKTQSDSDIHLIDRKRTFENSTKMYGNDDLITRVVSALGSIRQHDELSSSELGINGFSDSQILSTERSCSGWSLNRSDAEFHASRIASLNGSSQFTWNGSNSNDIRASQSIDTKDATAPSRPETFSRSVSLNIPEDDSNLQNILNREIVHRMLNKTNSPKSRILSSQGKRHSLVSSEIGSQLNLDRKNTKRGSIISLPREYISTTSKGRGSILSILDSPVNTSKSELLEKTSIADLIRALEIVHTTSQKEEGPVNAPPKMKNHLTQIMNSRRGSLRPIPAYTTIFSSDSMGPTRKISSQSTPDASLLSRHLSLRRYPPPPQYTPTVQKPAINRFSVRPSNTSPERNNPSIPPSILVQKKFPIGPSPLARNDVVPENAKSTGKKK